MFLVTDINLPDQTLIPTVYLAIILLNGAWNSRTIVSGNTCNIINTLPNFCIDPSKSVSDTGTSHFIHSQGWCSHYGIMARVVIVAEDWYTTNTDNDYNDVLLSVSSRYISDLQINDTSTS